MSDSRYEDFEHEVMAMSRRALQDFEDMRATGAAEHAHLLELGTALVAAMSEYHREARSHPHLVALAAATKRYTTATVSTRSVAAAGHDVALAPPAPARRRGRPRPRGAPRSRGHRPAVRRRAGSSSSTSSSDPGGGDDPPGEPPRYGAVAADLAGVLLGVGAVRR